jgi:hypothetical protein
MIFEPMESFAQTVHLTPTLTPSPSRLMRDSTWPMSPWSSIGCIQNNFQAYWHIWRKPCTYLASRLALPPNGPNWAFTQASSPRSATGYVQSDFWAYGTFGTNRAPILPQDYHYLQIDRNELLFQPHHLGVPSGLSKMIFEPMVSWPQIMHLTPTLTRSSNKPMRDST